MARQPRSTQNRTGTGGASSQGSPVLARIRLGAELRNLRLSANVSVQAAAKELRCSTAKISRLENGKGVPYDRDVRDLLNLYELNDARRRKQLFAWVEEGRARAWWSEFGDLLGPDSPLDRLIGLETEASEFLSFHPVLLPALLQTEEYARAVYSAILPGAEIDRLVAIRMRRQEILARTPDPLVMTAILDEGSLYRAVGGSTVMHQQLERVKETIANTENFTTVRILPHAAGAHEALGGGFILLRFASEVDQDTVFVESADGVNFLEGVNQVHKYIEIFEAVEKRTVGGVGAIDLIDKIAKTF